jgi:hypothetical protein
MAVEDRSNGYAPPSDLSTGLRCRPGDLALVVGPVIAPEVEVVRLRYSVVSVMAYAGEVRDGMQRTWVVESSLMPSHWIFMTDDILRPIRPRRRAAQRAMDDVAVVAGLLNATAA